MKITLIEARNPDGKLIDLWFDESEVYIQREVDRMVEVGYTDFAIVENPKNYAILHPQK